MNTIRRTNTKLETALADAKTQNLTFDFTVALAGRTSSHHTHRAYYRWVDLYLVDMAELSPTRGDARNFRMQNLPIPLLNDVLTPPFLRAWLGQLAREQGKQALDQARAAIITLADLVAEAGWLDDYASAAMARVRPPRAEEGQRPGRWLSKYELQALMAASKEVATSENQAIRNHTLTTILCTMALRREEIARAKWGDLSLQNNRIVMRVHGKGRKVAMVDVPKPVMRTIDQWRQAILASKESADPETPLLRRMWKGGRISKANITPDGIYWILQDAATQAGIGKVAPHDLRRSVAGALYEAEVPIEKISRLLRHSSVAITEKYINSLPLRNEGAVLMSDLLDLETDEEWPGY